MKIYSLVSICILSSITLGMQPKPIEQASIRNIASYDKIGPFVIGGELAFEKDYHARGEIRSFLWQHWKENRRGWLSATFYGIEGNKTASRFFVEPNRKGGWHLVIDSESTITSHASKGQKPKRVMRHEDYDQMNWVERKCKTDEHCVPMTEQALKDPSQYLLLLENRRSNAKNLF